MNWKVFEKKLSWPDLGTALRSRQLCNYSRTSQQFMEPEGPSEYSEETFTGSYPEPHQSSQYHSILSL
jgi:hypothetical protein